MANFDLHANFDYSLVATAPSPATSGTTLTVTTGQGALFPVPPFNAVVWPTGMQPLSTNAEIVRVTGVSTDTFTIVRNTTTENNNAFNRTIIVGDQVAVPISYKMITDIEGAITALQTSGFTADGGSATTTYTGVLKIDYGGAS